MASDMTVSPKQFWEVKILSWEEGRYKNPGERVGFVERIANRVSDSLRFRIAITPELLKPHLPGKRVVELGCGSGLLAPRFMAYGAKSYLGIDIAERAIAEARRQFVHGGSAMRFEVGDVGTMGPLDADLIVSLGLLDWLTDAEIATMFENSGGADVFHAIAEKRNHIHQYIHRFYVYLAYAHRTGCYRPRYLTCRHIQQLADQVVPRPLYVYRDKRLSFGALISTLPIERQA
jgi:SAM-dependent methyltransferase